MRNNEATGSKEAKKARLRTSKTREMLRADEALLIDRGISRASKGKILGEKSRKDNTRARTSRANCVTLHLRELICRTARFNEFHQDSLQHWRQRSGIKCGRGCPCAVAKFLFETDGGIYVDIFLIDRIAGRAEP